MELEAALDLKAPLSTLKKYKNYSDLVTVETPYSIERIRKGFALYGNDIDDTTSPLEAGLGWVTKFAEGKDFIDREFLAQQKAEGVQRKLVGLKMIDRGIPRHGYKLSNLEGEEIGVVTSGTMSPMLKVGIALGYVKSEYAAVGTTVAVVIRDRLLKAEVVKYPFV